MTLPVLQPSAHDTYGLLKNSGTNLVIFVQNIQQQAATPGTVTLVSLATAINQASVLVGMVQQVQAATAANANLKAALDSYVQQQTGNPTLNVSAELGTSLAALQSLVTAMTGDYPKDANGFLLDRTFAANGSIITSGTIQAASLQGTLSAITAWLNTIS